MAVCEVYSQSVSVRYKSALCSKSAMFSVTTTLLTIIIPFLVAYRSHGFWLRSSSYREQPKVSFKHQYLFYFETDLPDVPIICSNLPLSWESDYCTMIKSREEDSNQDDKHDRLLIDVEVDVPSNLSVYSVQIFLIFDYKLQTHLLLQMESAGYIHFSSGLPFSKLEMSGELRLVQKQLLRNGIRDIRFNTSIFKFGSDPSMMLSFQEALRDYGKREVSTSLVSVYQTWTRGLLLNGPLELSLDIDYPEETIYYSPSFWQILKWAWVQYLAILIIFAYIARVVKSYVFTNNLIPTLKEIPWKSPA